MPHLLYFKGPFGISAIGPAGLSRGGRYPDLDGYLLMQRFTLIHDGSDQGWQAVYLAFHIAAQLGAPLFVLLFDPSGNKDILAKRAAQVEVGGHAAGVAIGTQLVWDLTTETVAENSSDSNGLFVPGRLIPDEKTALHFLEALSCPLWIVSHETQMQGMAVLVGDPAANATLLNYAEALSVRIQQALTGLVLESKLDLVRKANPAITWQPLPELSPQAITAALNQLGVSLLFLPDSSLSLLGKLAINYIVYRTYKDGQE